MILRGDSTTKKVISVPKIGLLVINRLSDNVAPVKHFLGVLTRALRRARHFALVEGFAIPTKARS